jgi:carbonic anhydrase/acetyltransferase-like protein (isoleucine patch superfamily)
MAPVVIGDNVTVGHRAIIHGCSIGNHALIGMGATILDNAEIGEYCIIGAHTLITKGMVIPPRSLVIGSPGKVQRSLTDDEVAGLKESALHYQESGATYRRLLAQQG